MKIHRKLVLDEDHLSSKSSLNELDSDGNISNYAVNDDVEQAYVEDAYAIICDKTKTVKTTIRSDVREFVEELDFYSWLIDVGCGNGHCLHLNKNIFSVGFDNCDKWFEDGFGPSVVSNAFACNVISIPVRDQLFDALLCLEVLHHLSTVARRVKALQEISRILKVNGRALITVKAFEGYEDVLIQHDFKYDAFETLASKRAKSRSAMYDTEFFMDFSPMIEMTTCYSFVRRAFQKFMFIPETYSHSRTKLRKKEHFIPQVIKNIPIELRNIDQNASKVKCINKYKRIRQKQTNNHIPTDNRHQHYFDHANQSFIKLLKEKLDAKEKLKGTRNKLRKFSLPVLPAVLRKFSISEVVMNEELINFPTKSDDLIIYRKLSKSFSVENKFDGKAVKENRKDLKKEHTKICRSLSLSELDKLDGQHWIDCFKLLTEENDLIVLASKIPETCVGKSASTKETVQNRAVRPTTLIPLRFPRKSPFSIEKESNNFSFMSKLPPSVSPLVTETLRADMFLSADSEESVVTIIPAKRDNDIRSNEISGDESNDDEDAIAEGAGSIISSDDDAICDLPSLESCSDAQVKSDDSLMPSTSTSKTTTPTELMDVHIYYHLFRYGELESLIENYVSGLSIEKAYYYPDNTWNVLVKKV